jgi:hypothetical protein
MLNVGRQVRMSVGSIMIMMGMPVVVIMIVSRLNECNSETSPKHCAPQTYHEQA